MNNKNGLITELLLEKESKTELIGAKLFTPISNIFISIDNIMYEKSEGNFIVSFQYDKKRMRQLGLTESDIQREISYIVFMYEEYYIRSFYSDKNH